MKRFRFSFRHAALAVALAVIVTSSGVAVAHEGSRRELVKRVMRGASRGEAAEQYDGFTPESAQHRGGKGRASTTTVAPNTSTPAPTTPPTTAVPATTAVPVTTAAPAPTTATTVTRPAAAAPTTASTSSTRAPAPAAAANAKYVSLTGDDSNAGGEATPWKTLPVAISRLNPGDTLYVRGGTYQLAANSAMYIEGKNGAADRWLRILAYPGEAPIVRLNDQWNGIKVANSSYVSIGGLELVGTAGSDQRYTSGIEVRNSHHVTAERNKVHDVGGCGICAIESNHVTIAGNVIYNTSNWNPYQTSAISFFTSRDIGGGANADGYSMYIAGNSVRGARNVTPPANGEPTTDGNCIIIDFNKTFGYSGRTLVINNHCYENGGRGVHVFHSKDVDVVNNTLVNNLRSAEIDGGELTASSATGVLWRNNLVSPQRAGAGNIAWDATATYDHNLYVGQAPPLRGATDLVVPSAVGADNRPFAGSAAINASNPALAPAADITGRARAGVADIGAFES